MEKTCDDVFSVSSHDIIDAVEAEKERYLKDRAAFLIKYGDPSSKGYHRRRADEDVRKPNVTMGNDYADLDIFERVVLNTLDYHGNLLAKMESRLCLIEEKYRDTQDTLDTLVVETRRTRQLLEYRTRRDQSLHRQNIAGKDLEGNNESSMKNK